jgi:preprotein translocase subunit YajC
VNATWTILYVAALMAAGYFLLIRPQQKRTKEQAQLMAALKPGERVMTAGGIYGTIVTLRGDRVELRIADNVVIEITRSSIVRMADEDSDASGADDPTPLDKPASEDVEEPHVHVDGATHDAEAEAADDAGKDE